MNKIKNIMKSKVTMVVLACLLLVGVFAGISAIAGEGEPVVKIVATNLSHDATPTIMYEVQISGLTEAPDPEAVEMKFWNSENFDVYKEADDVATKADDRVELIDYADGVATLYCYSKGFAPKQMTDTIYATATYADKYSAVVNYSVFQYLCEANMNGGTTEQTALWDAMERYITYAQQYLGWDKSTTPDQLGYVKVTNAYFTVGDGTERYTSGTFKAGTSIHIRPDLPEGKEYGAMINQYGQIMTNATEEGHYDPDIVAGTSRHYTVLPATTITFTGEGTLLQVAKGTPTKGGTGTQFVYTPIKSLTTGASITATSLETRAFVLTAAATATDENGAVMTFSYWEDGTGNKISEDLTYFCDELIDFTKEEVTIAARPVYAAPEVTYDIGAATATGGSNGAVVTNLPTGMTFDLSKKSGSGGSATMTSATQTVNGTLRSIVYDMTLQIPVIGETTQGDYFNKTGFACHFKQYLKLNNGNLVLLSLISKGKDNSLTSKHSGYYFRIDQNDKLFNEFSNTVLNFGQDYKITVDVKLNDDATKSSSIALYVDGTLVGVISGIAVATVGGNATAGYTATSLARTIGIITVTDVMAYGYLK